MIRRLTVNLVFIAQTCIRHGAIERGRNISAIVASSLYCPMVALRIQRCANAQIHTQTQPWPEKLVPFEEIKSVR